jgi:hypothetical protein
MIRWTKTMGNTVVNTGLGDLVRFVHQSLLANVNYAIKKALTSHKGFIVNKGHIN